MSAGEIKLLDFGTREAWLAGRGSGVGASESAALFGVSPWETPLSLWAKKTGRMPPDEIDAEWLEWGTLLEPAIAARYESKTGRRVWQGGPFCVAQHPAISCMRATPDRWVIEASDRDPNGLLQIKNTNAFKGHDWDDGPPDFIQVQVQHEMAVTGRAWCSVAVLIGGCEFRYFDVERNDDFIAELEQQCVAFWARVERDEQPDVVPHRRTLEIVKRLHPRDSGEVIALTGEADAWLQKLTAAKEAIKAADEDKDLAEAKLRLLIGDATFGEFPDGRRLSLKTTANAGYTKVVEPYTYRTLRVEKAPKGKTR